jgi:hypothetical protein
LNHSTGESQYLSSDGTPRRVWPVSVTGGRVLAVEIQGRTHILLAAAMLGIGVDPEPQIERLAEVPGASFEIGSSRGDESPAEILVACDVRTFLALLATLDERPSSEAERSLMVAYMTELPVALVSLDAGVPGTRASGHLADQAAALAALRGVVDAGWLEAKARQLVGGLLGETPEHDEQSKPLTVSIFLTQKGLSDSEIRKISGPFGKRVRQRFVDVHGAEPPVIEDLVGRHMVPVRQYQERHRPLFNDVWWLFRRPGGGTSRPRGRQN